MLVLINTNRMMPAIGPLGIEYVAGAARAAGVDVDVLDLCLAGDPDAALSAYFGGRRPQLVGLSFRNVDDSFWPKAQTFLPELRGTVARLRELTDAPVALGGVGFSIFAERIVEYTGADFGIRGDGEQATLALLAELDGRRRFERVPGLIWRADGRLRANLPAWPKQLRLPTARDAIDNAAYFRLGGQGGIETKRGCPRSCIYCADPVAKGFAARPRPPAEVADEVESLLRQGVDVLHLCDGEFNVPPEHAAAVCDELIARKLGDRVRWYTYMTVVPFDAELAGKMRRAGCVGIDFTSDSAAEAVLQSYRLPHRKQDLARAVDLCRANGITVMLDLLLGGPGETPETLADSIGFFKRIGPDCVGAQLGMRLYPGTPAAGVVAAEGPLQTHPAIRRKYEGPVDLLWPTFYISAALGDRPAAVARELIGGDERFFEPEEEAPAAGEVDSDLTGDHNYNANEALARAIAAGQRGAYWHILHKLRARQAVEPAPTTPYPGAAIDGRRTEGRPQDEDGAARGPHGDGGDGGGLRL
jgi:radical SAM superfamily enzyme YgiQ (UPF0313 family)